MIKKTHFLREFALFFYLCSGTLGVLWISDDFNSERFLVTAFLGIPLSAIVLYLYITNKKTLGTQTGKFLIGVLIITFLWGNILLINAISDSERVTYTHVTQSQIEQKSLRMTYLRGGLGILYRKRW